MLIHLKIRRNLVDKGIKFQDIRDAGDPVECAYRYQEDGADELVVLDISATLESRQNSLEVIQAIREVLNIPLTVGGGVRSLEDVRALLEAGADKVSINSAAVARPQMINDIAQLAGKQCTVVAIDAAKANGVWQVLTHSGKRQAGLMALEWAQTIEKLGGGELLLTSWDRDGTRSGYDLDLLSAVRSVTRLPIIASGGAASAKHMIEGIDAGADAVLAASIFHDGETSCNQLKIDIQQKYKRTDIKVRL